MKFAVLGLPRSGHLKGLILDQLGRSEHEFLIVEERNREAIDGGWSGVRPGQNTTVELLDRFDQHDLAAVLSTAHVQRLIALSDRSSVVAAELRVRLGLPGNSIRSERWVTDKSLMRQRLADCGLTSIRSHRTTLDRLIADTAGHRLPFVVKPVDLGASLCVQLITSMDQLEPYLRRCRENRVFTTNPLVVEEYVPGPELSVEGIVLGWNTTFFGITESHHSGEPYFVGTGHDFFADHEDAEAIYRYTASVIAALEIDDSLFHIELKRGPRGLDVIEAHTRFAGTMIAELVRHATGLEVFRHLADGLAGTAPVPAPARSPGLYAQHLLCSAPGRVDAIALAPELLNAPRVTSHALDCRVGDSIEPDVLPVQYIGYINFSATDRKDAADYRRQLTEGLTVELDQRAHGVPA